MRLPAPVVQPQRPHTAPPVTILMYHQVGRFPAPKAHRAVYCDIGRFKAQMAWLKHLGYPVISLQAAYEGLFSGAPLPPRAVVLTFDDGYQNFADEAWPVLRAHGFPASVFIVADRVGGDDGWRRDAPDRARLMDAPTLRALRAEGVNFGSHALSHPRLSQLPLEAACREVRDSKARLEDLFGAAVPDFCYPYGDYSPAVRDCVADAGYRLALTCIRGAANTADNPFEIPRKAISYGDNLIGFAWKLHMKHARKGGDEAYD